MLAQINIGDKLFGNESRGGFGGSFLPFQRLSGIGDFVSLFVRGAFVLAGIIILFFFIMAGIGMIAGAGGSDPQKMEQSKKTATSALIGFIVVFASYWIVQLIGQFTGINILGTQ